MKVWSLEVRVVNIKCILLKIIFEKAVSRHAHLVLPLSFIKPPKEIIPESQCHSWFRNNGK